MNDHADLGPVVVQEAHGLNSQVRPRRDFPRHKGPRATGSDENGAYLDQALAAEFVMSQPLIAPPRTRAQKYGGKDAQQIVDQEGPNGYRCKP